MLPNCKFSIPLAASKLALGTLRIGLYLAIVFAFCCASRVSAAVVILKGSNQVVMGYLVRQDDQTVTLREALPGNKQKETTFSRGQIDELILTVSSTRLTALDPAQPGFYIAYVEDLAVKHRAPASL